MTSLGLFFFPLGIKFEIIRLTSSFAVIYPSRTPDTVCGPWLQDVIRQGLAEVSQVGRFQGIPGGDEIGLVRETGLAFRHMMVLHQPAPPDEDGVARHQPGEDPLVVDGGPVHPGHPLAVHKLWPEELHNRLELEIRQQGWTEKLVGGPLVDILTSSTSVVSRADLTLFSMSSLLQLSLVVPS